MVIIICEAYDPNESMLSSNGRVTGAELNGTRKVSFSCDIAAMEIQRHDLVGSKRILSKRVRRILERNHHYRNSIIFVKGDDLYVATASDFYPKAMEIIQKQIRGHAIKLQGGVNRDRNLIYDEELADVLARSLLEVLA